MEFDFLITSVSEMLWNVSPRNMKKQKSLVVRSKALLFFKMLCFLFILVQYTFFIRKPLFWVSLDLLNITLEIRLRFS